MSRPSSKFTDEAVLLFLRRLKRRGRTEVRAGEVARAFSVDSVQALGAMLRVERRVRDAS